MNKKFLYISIAGIVGLLAGYLIFGKPVDESTASKDVSEVSNTHDHSGETANQMWTCSMQPQIMQP